MKTSDTFGTPFSYAVKTNDNELLVGFDTGGFAVLINNDDRSVTAVVIPQI